MVNCSTPCDELFYNQNEGNSCSFKENYYVFIDDTFTNEQKDKVLNGLYCWQSSTNSRIVISSSEQYSHDKMFNAMCDSRQVLFIALNSPQDDVEINIIDGLSNGATPKGFSDGCKIYLITNRIPPEDFETVIVHEFGHSIGLHHSLNSTSIMFPNIAEMSECIKNEHKPSKEDIDNLNKLKCGG